MYPISNEKRQKIYNGGLYYTPIVTIGGVTIPYTEIKSISIDDPIIDASNQTMYIGTFIAKKLDMEFRTLQNIDLTQQIDYSIKINDNGTETIVPIGLFNIETSPTDYYKTYKLTALDNSVKFKNSYNFSTEYTDILDDKGKVIGKSITASKMLQVLCNLSGVLLNPLSNDLVNKECVTGYEDNTMSAKQWVSYIAEIMGGFAKIDRDGNLSIVPVKTTPVTTINALASKSFTIDEVYRITKVRYEDGIVVPSERALPTDDGNTLNIRPDNKFVQGTDDERNTLINNIGNAVLGLTIQNLTTENYADFTLDAYDLVNYTLGNTTYTTYYANSFAFKGSIMGKVDVKLPTKNQEQTTNVVGGVPDSETIRGVKTTVDQLKGEFILETAKTTVMDGKITKINNAIFEADGDTIKFVVKEQLVNGDVKKVDANNYILDSEGLKIERKNENDEYIEDTRSRLNGLGLSIIKNDDNRTILYAGYDNSSKQSIVRTQNTTVENYLVLNDGDITSSTPNGNDVGRFEVYDYSDGSNSIIDDTKRVGFFWVYD